MVGFAYSILSDSDHPTHRVLRALSSLLLQASCVLSTTQASVDIPLGCHWLLDESTYTDQLTIPRANIAAREAGRKTDESLTNHRWVPDYQLLLLRRSNSSRTTRLASNACFADPLRSKDKASHTSGVQRVFTTPGLVVLLESSSLDLLL